MCASQNVPSDLGSKAAGKRLKAFWVQGRDGGKEVKEGMRQRKKKRSQGEEEIDAAKIPQGWRINQSTHGYVGSKASFSL